MPIDARKVVLAPAGAAIGTPGGVAISGLRLGFRAISMVSPASAARAAAQLWFRPPRPAIRPEARLFMDTGARSSLEVNDRPVALWQWGAGPTVILVHGWGGYGGQMRPYVEPLVAAGYRVVIFDAPAHGESGPSRLGGRRTTLFDFADVVHRIGRDQGELAGIIAHSGGATAVAWSLLSARWKARSLVFVAPMASPSSYKNMFLGALGLTEEVIRLFDEHTEGQFGFRWSELEVPEIASRVGTPPLLVVHDRGDVETSWHESEAIAGAWPRSLLHTTEGLGHRRVLWEPGVVDVVTEFIRTNAPAARG